jgi:4-hydroxymandelate oxidase
MARQTRRDVLMRVAPREELVCVPEFEAEAARVLADNLARALAGSDRAAFERITFRPRMMVNCVDLNLGLDLFGQSLFAPILIGPVADQRRFHPEAELATLRGAAAAKAAVVLSSRSSLPVTELAAQAATPLFYQAFASDDAARVRAGVQDAERAGCNAVVVTVGPDERSDRRPGRRDWSAVDAVRGATALPVVVKGVLTPDDATTAVAHGARGLIVSSHGRAEGTGQPAPLDAVGPIVAAVPRDVPVLVDGGVRRGTDVMKALAVGARAVLVARPVMWGLAAYGADGVQSVIELLQTELGRVMGCCGAPNLAAIARSMIKVHSAPAPTSTP